MKSSLKIIKRVSALSMILLAILLTSCRVDGGLDGAWEVNQWTSLGPEGGFIRALVIDPINTDTIYTGTGVGVFKSTDGGTNWTITSQEMWVTALAINPVITTKVYAGTGYNGICIYNYQ